MPSTYPERTLISEIEAAQRANAELRSPLGAHAAVLELAELAKQVGANGVIGASLVGQALAGAVASAAGLPVFSLADAPVVRPLVIEGVMVTGAGCARLLRDVSCESAVIATVFAAEVPAWLEVMVDKVVVLRALEFVA